VLHLADNVAEWTDEARATVIVLPGPGIARPARTVFGGSFESADAVRHVADAQITMYEDERAAFVGFRCACSLEEVAR
jgi:hypothetical protein